MSSLNELEAERKQLEEIIAELQITYANVVYNTVTSIIHLDKIEQIAGRFNSQNASAIYISTLCDAARLSFTKNKESDPTEQETTPFLSPKELETVRKIMMKHIVNLDKDDGQ